MVFEPQSMTQSIQVSSRHIRLPGSYIRLQVVISRIQLTHQPCWNPAAYLYNKTSWSHSWNYTSWDSLGWRNYCLRVQSWALVLQLTTGVHCHKQAHVGPVPLVGGWRSNAWQPSRMLGSVEVSGSMEEGERRRSKVRLDAGGSGESRRRCVRDRTEWDQILSPMAWYWTLRFCPG